MDTYRRLSQDALCLMRALQLARRLPRDERDAKRLRHAMVEQICLTPSAQIDYAGGGWLHWNRLQLLNGRS